MPTLPQTSRHKSQEALANIRTSKNPNPAKKLCYTRMCFLIRYKSCHDRMPQSACVRTFVTKSSIYSFLLKNFQYLYSMLGEGGM